MCPGSLFRGYECSVSSTVALLPTMILISSSTELLKAVVPSKRRQDLLVVFKFVVVVDIELT